MLLGIAALFLAVAGKGAGENIPVSGDSPPLLGGDAPPDEGTLTAPGKVPAGDAAPGNGAAGKQFSPGEIENLVD